MSLEKAEIKKAAVQEVGVLLDDALEAANRSVEQHQGGTAALQVAAKQVSGLFGHVDKDMDEGKFSDLDGPLAVAKVVKLYVQRAVVVIESQAKIADSLRLSAQGEVNGLTKAVALTKKIYDTEEGKARRAAELLDAAEGSPGERVIGDRPGQTIKERRLAEEGPQTAAPSVPSEPATSESEPTPKKPRRRSKKDNTDGANA